MQSQVSEISPVEVEVKVEIPWERVQKDLEAQYRQVGQQARVKGFRPGKVPARVLKRLFGPQVRGEVTASLVEEGLMTAVVEHQLQIVSQPEVDAPPIEEGKPLTFTAKMEIRPTVESVDTSRLELVRPAAEVTDGQVSEEVERLRREHATVRVPEPMRPARAGDELTIDYKVSIDGEEKPDMGATERTVELGAERLLPEFEEGLIGLVPGDEKEVAVGFADDHGREDLRGKTATFQVKVGALRERVLPELDDEFSKDVGDYETLLELRLKIREHLETMAGRHAEAALRDQLIDRLVETNDVPVPPSMIHQEEQRMMYEFAAFLQMSGNEPIPMSDELHASMHGRAERKVKAAILLSSLAHQQKLEVAEEDVERKLGQIAEQTGKHIAKVRVDYAGERRDALESQLLEEKLMDYLMGQAKITDAPPAGEGAEAKEPGSDVTAAAGGEAGVATGKKTPKKKAPARKKAETPKDEEKAGE